MSSRPSRWRCRRRRTMRGWNWSWGWYSLALGSDTRTIPSCLTLIIRPRVSYTPTRQTQRGITGAPLTHRDSSSPSSDCALANSSFLYAVSKSLLSCPDPVLVPGARCPLPYSRHDGMTRQARASTGGTSGTSGTSSGRLSRGFRVGGSVDTRVRAPGRLALLDPVPLMWLPAPEKIVTPRSPSPVTP